MPLNKRLPIFVLLFQCRDQRGIVAAISEFVLSHAGNIITADQYTTDPQKGDFFMRVEFLIEQGSCDKASLSGDFLCLAQKFNAEYMIYDRRDTLRMGVFVSKPDHCLLDLLYLQKSGELQVDIPFVASNYSGHRELVEQYKIPFYYIAAGKDDRKESELLSIASGNSDFLVLARYMLVLSGEFLGSYAKDIINIHHGFLPSFKGPNPYRQALQEGVKVIGSTAHFVNEMLDAGPIISQMVEYVSHKEDMLSLLRKGKNLERRALSSAISSYIDYRIIRYKNRTIVF